ncbi:MAG TPA: ABC transporter permease [Gemmatimonadaceae bacterium]|jgi:predicted permease
MTRDDDRVPAWRRYLRFSRANTARDVDDELSFHLQSTIDELVAAGMTRDAAFTAARQKFGDVDGISRTLYNLSEQRERTMDRSEWWASVWQDVAFGLRQLRKSRGFTIVALLTLALGIGANSAIFSVVHAVMLAPLPYANSDRIIQVREKNGEYPNDVTFGNYVSWTQSARSFDAIAAWWGSGSATLTGVGDPVRITGDQTTANYWKVFNIKPVLGGYFTEDDAREGAAKVVVLSTALWRNRFGADPAIVGKSIMLNGAPVRVVGVAPQEYLTGGESGERIWSPLVIPAQRANDHKDHELSVAGMVKAGVSNEAAIRELSSIERRLAVEYPHSGFDDVSAKPYAEALVGNTSKMLYMLFGAVLLVLLIACANVANLLIARAARRRAEIAVRRALGASRGRIIRQLFVESLLLGVAGGVLGLGVGYAGIRFLVSSPISVPRLHDASLSWPVVAFTLGLSVGCALLFGLVPALRAARTDLQQTLRDGGRESASASRDLFRAALVVGELCLAQVLLVAAALLIRSMMAMSSVPIGFDTHNLLALNLALPPSRYAGDARIQEGFRRIETAMVAIPGVKSVGRAQVVPIYGSGWSWSAMRPGSNGHDERAVSSEMRFISPGLFKTLSVPMLRGRSFANADEQDGAPGVAIVSRSLAKDLYGDVDPVGKLISNGSVEKPGWREIVGIVDDIRAGGPGDEVRPTLYLPSTALVNPTQTILVRGNIEAVTLMPAIRRAVAGVDPLLAVAAPSTIDASLSRLLAIPRFTTLLLTCLGLTGLVLAVVGVYGVVSYFVTQRTHEFGVRLALGASSSTVQSLVVRQGLGFAVLGVGFGVVLSFVAVRLLQNMLFGVTTHDLLTYVAVAGILGVVTVGASYIPARRATRIDPLEALRSS